MDTDSGGERERETAGGRVMRDEDFIKLALKLARRGYGATSPNPMVGAVLVKRGEIIGRGWHRGAGAPHAELEAIRDAERRGQNPKGATFYVTLEPCCTQGRTPPCTQAITGAGIKRVVVGATDPNPLHSGRAFEILKHAGIPVIHGVLTRQCEELNEAFNHWIVHRTPFVTVKAAMTLDGKIATAGGESKWITGPQARAHGMRLRQGADAILVGINTILADNPSLTVRTAGEISCSHPLRRIILDAQARVPLDAKVVSDHFAAWTTIVVGKAAPVRRVAALRRRVNVLISPLERGVARHPRINLKWLLKQLGGQAVTSLLVEGGGEVNASFLLGGLAHRVAFFYAPKILGGRDSRPGVAGVGLTSVHNQIKLENARWHRLGVDLLLTARIAGV